MTGNGFVVVSITLDAIDSRPSLIGSVRGCVRYIALAEPDFAAAAAGGGSARLLPPNVRAEAGCFLSDAVCLF